MAEIQSFRNISDAYSYARQTSINPAAPAQDIELYELIYIVDAATVQYIEIEPIVNNKTLLGDADASLDITKLYEFKNMVESVDSSLVPDDFSIFKPQIKQNTTAAEIALMSIFSKYFSVCAAIAQYEVSHEVPPASEAANPYGFAPAGSNTLKARLHPDKATTYAEITNTYEEALGGSDNRSDLPNKLKLLYYIQNTLQYAAPEKLNTANLEATLHVLYNADPEQLPIGLINLITAYHSEAMNKTFPGTLDDSFKLKTLENALKITASRAAELIRGQATRELNLKKADAASRLGEPGVTVRENTAALKNLAASAAKLYQHVKHYNDVTLNPATYTTDSSSPRYSPSLELQDLYSSDRLTVDLTSDLSGQINELVSLEIAAGQVQEQRFLNPGFFNKGSVLSAYIHYSTNAETYLNIIENLELEKEQKDRILQETRQSREAVEAALQPINLKIKEMRSVLEDPRTPLADKLRLIEENQNTYLPLYEHIVAELEIVFCDNIIKNIVSTSEALTILNSQAYRNAVKNRSNTVIQDVLVAKTSDIVLSSSLHGNVRDLGDLRDALLDRRSRIIPNKLNNQQLLNRLATLSAQHNSAPAVSVAPGYEMPKQTITVGDIKESPASKSEQNYTIPIADLGKLSPKDSSGSAVDALPNGTDLNDVTLTIDGNPVPLLDAVTYVQGYSQFLNSSGRPIALLFNGVVYLMDSNGRVTGTADPDICKVTINKDGSISITFTGGTPSLTGDANSDTTASSIAGVDIDSAAPGITGRTEKDGKTQIKLQHVEKAYIIVNGEKVPVQIITADQGASASAHVIPPVLRDIVFGPPAEEPEETPPVVPPPEDPPTEDPPKVDPPEDPPSTEDPPETPPVVPPPEEPGTEDPPETPPVVPPPEEPGTEDPPNAGSPEDPPSTEDPSNVDPPEDPPSTEEPGETPPSSEQPDSIPEGYFILTKELIDYLYYQQGVLYLDNGKGTGISELNFLAVVGEENFTPPPDTSKFNMEFDRLNPYSMNNGDITPSALLREYGKEFATGQLKLGDQIILLPPLTTHSGAYVQSGNRIYGKGTNSIQILIIHADGSSEVKTVSITLPDRPPIFEKINEALPDTSDITFYRYYFGTLTRQIFSDFNKDASAEQRLDYLNYIKQKDMHGMCLSYSVILPEKPGAQDGKIRSTLPRTEYLLFNNEKLQKAYVEIAQANGGVFGEEDLNILIPLLKLSEKYPDGLPAEEKDRTKLVKYVRDTFYLELDAGDLPSLYSIAQKISEKISLNENQCFMLSSDDLAKAEGGSLSATVSAGVDYKQGEEGTGTVEGSLGLNLDWITKYNNLKILFDYSLPVVFSTGINKFEEMSQSNLSFRISEVFGLPQLQGVFVGMGETRLTHADRSHAESADDPLGWSLSDQGGSPNLNPSYLGGLLGLQGKFTLQANNPGISQATSLFWRAFFGLQATHLEELGWQALSMPVIAEVGGNSGHFGLKFSALGLIDLSGVLDETKTPYAQIGPEDENVYISSVKVDWTSKNWLSKVPYYSNENNIQWSFPLALSLDLAKGTLNESVSVKLSDKNPNGSTWHLGILSTQKLFGRFFQPRLFDLDMGLTGGYTFANGFSIRGSVNFDNILSSISDDSAPPVRVNIFADIPIKIPPKK